MKTEEKNRLIPRQDDPSADRRPLDLDIRAAKLDAREVRLGDVLTLDEIRLTGGGISLTTGGGIKIAELNATIVITELALNSFLEGRSEDSLHDLKVNMLTGKVRVEGKYGLIPFAYTGVPEIEGGARLRLDPRQMSIIGLPIPGAGVHVIGERLNTQLARAFDVTRLNLPIRLTQLTIETGRVLLSGTAAVNVERVSD